MRMRRDGKKEREWEEEEAHAMVARDDRMNLTQERKMWCSFASTLVREELHLLQRREKRSEGDHRASWLEKKTKKEMKGEENESRSSLFCCSLCVLSSLVPRFRFLLLLPSSTSSMLLLLQQQQLTHTQSQPLNLLTGERESSREAGASNAQRRESLLPSSSIPSFPLVHAAPGSLMLQLMQHKQRTQHTSIHS